jgi:hypothetical protein
MPVMMIRAKIRPEMVGEVEMAAKKVFAEVENAKPEGLQYAAAKVPNGVEFVIFLNLAEGAQNPLSTLPAYRDFMHRLKDWIAGPPSQEPLTMVGSYNLFQS